MMMLILTAFSLTFVALLKASMIAFGAGMALFLFSTILIVVVFSLLVSVISLITTGDLT